MLMLFQFAVLLGYSAQALSPPPNVWKVFGEISERTQSVNLGLGFPDWNPPQFVIDSLHGATSHQYTRPSGHPELVHLLASRYSMHLNRHVDPASEIAVTVGASQSLYLALITLLQQDDEIVIFEPFFELYAKQIALTKAKPVYVKLGGEAATLSDPWALDINLLKRFFHITYFHLNINLTSHFYYF
jgi:aspartate/methionine/tyrosine aminotransferase